MLTPVTHLTPWCLVVSARHIVTLQADLTPSPTPLDRAASGVGPGPRCATWCAPYARIPTQTRHDGGLLLRRASAEHAAALVQEMADAVVSLDGLRLLAPAPRRPAFP